MQTRDRSRTFWSLFEVNQTILEIYPQTQKPTEPQRDAARNSIYPRTVPGGGVIDKTKTFVYRICISLTEEDWEEWLTRRAVSGSLFLS